MLNTNRALGGTANIALDDKLRNTNTFLELGTVSAVNSVLGNITVTIGKEKFPLRVNGLSQRSGSVNVYIPVVGDNVWVYRDATYTTLLGYVITDETWLIQDTEVQKNLEITQPRLFPPLDPGNHFIRSSQGASLALKDNVILQDSAGSSIEIDSNQDKIELFSSSIEQNMLNSEIKAGLTKRYNPVKNVTYDSVIFDPASNDTEPMSEFTVFLGKSLKKELDSTDNYLTGSDSDPNFKKVDLEEGKEDTPKITFSMSDTAVVDINGETFPTFETLKLHMLLEIAEDFAFKVNTHGSFLIGKAGASGINGLYYSNDDKNPFLSLGLDKGNQLSMRKDGSVSLENPKGFYKIMDNGLIQLSAGSKVLVNMDPTDGKEKFEIILTTDPNLIVTASADGVNINAGGMIVKISDGKMQVNGQVNLGLPLPGGSLGLPYEHALMGDSFILELNLVLAGLLTLVTTLSQPTSLIGLAIYPQVNANAGALIPLLTQFIAKLTASSVAGQPFLSKQVSLSH